jgi:hypothetical protein
MGREILVCYRPCVETDNGERQKNAQKIESRADIAVLVQNAGKCLHMSLAMVVFIERL